MPRLPLVRVSRQRLPEYSMLFVGGYGLTGTFPVGLPEDAVELCVTAETGGVNGFQNSGASPCHMFHETGQHHRVTVAIERDTHL